MNSRSALPVLIACCAFVALQVNSTPFGRAARVSVGVAVKVPPSVQESRQFAWNGEDGLAEGGRLSLSSSSSEVGPGINAEELRSEGDVVPLTSYGTENGKDFWVIKDSPPLTSYGTENGKDFWVIKDSPPEESNGAISEPTGGDSVPSTEEYVNSPEDEEGESGPLANLLDEAVANLDASSAPTADIQSTNDEEEEDAERTDAEPELQLPTAAEEAVDSSVPVLEDAETVANTVEEEPRTTIPEPEPLSPSNEETYLAEIGAPIKVASNELYNVDGEERESLRRRKRDTPEMENDDDLEEFREEALNQFNFYRHRVVGLPAVRLDDELNEGAQAWAEHMLTTGSTKMSQCDECVYIETFVHKKVTSARRDVPRGTIAADWIMSRWFKKATGNTEDPYSKALLRRDGLSKMGIGIIYSRDGDKKELFAVARFE